MANVKSRLKTPKRTAKGQTSSKESKIVKKPKKREPMKQNILERIVTSELCHQRPYIKTDKVCRKSRKEPKNLETLKRKTNHSDLSKNASPQIDSPKKSKYNRIDVNFDILSRELGIGGITQKSKQKKSIPSNDYLFLRPDFDKHIPRSNLKDLLKRLPNNEITNNNNLSPESTLENDKEVFGSNRAKGSAKPIVLRQKKKKRVSKKSIRLMANLVSPEKSYNGLERKLDVQDTLMQISKMKKHLEHAAPEPYVCDYCSKKFINKSDLRKHIYIHLEIKPFPCPHCPMHFRQDGNRKVHMARLHSESTSGANCFICDICNKTFLIKQAIKVHLLTHINYKPYSCGNCTKKFGTRALLTQHVKLHKDERYQCPHCTSTYSNRARMELHIKGHLGVKEHICHVCGKEFLRLESIRKHLSSYHGDKRFECPVCFKQLKGHLTEHMRTHIQLRPHECPECGQRFVQASHLAVHRRSHSGVKPYSCRICLRPFTHSNALLLHVRRHTGEKPFPCAMCPITFSQLPHMKAHMRKIHGKLESYKCKKCNTFFKLKSQIEAHNATCRKGDEDLSFEEQLSRSLQVPEVDAAMSLSRMRFLLAVLLRTIADDDRLKVLGFNKRLIDDLLVESLEATGRKPCTDTSITPLRRLKTNIEILLNWTVPADIMANFKRQNKSTEELLQELTK